jgi:cytochrome c oxidase subunit 3
LRLGFLLFIVSEIMLFFGFFWAFFHGSLSPALEIGSIYPPDGIRVINPFGFPLYNTAILIISGLSVT